MEDVIARVSLIGVPVNGREQEIEVSVGKPRPHNGAWACAVAVLGLDSRPREVYGEDSLQSLCLGLGIVRTLLMSFLEAGGQLLDPDGREPFPLTAYFPASETE